MKPKTKRLITITSLMIIFCLGCGILFYNLKSNLVFFFSPSEILDKEISSGQKIRLGGMVKKGSIEKNEIIHEGKVVQEIKFIITDFKQEIRIGYVGILPDLFAEGQGVVVEGNLLNKKQFKAKIILAKHDENYMPPELDKIEMPTN
tara:strand:+ start:1967 stop:2407 length:441 start_codon:yes stop_codon:yes gene_type:complete